MEVRLLVVTSNVGSRRRALGVAVALAMVGALLSAQTAFGAGDPIATGTFGLKLSGGFKKQLKRNHVSMKPKKFTIKANSSLDPTTGAGTIQLGKITFKKGGKKLVYGNSKAILGSKGKISGSAGKLFSLSTGTVTRNGFGATVSGIKVKFLKSAAKRINKKLGLHSLHAGGAGNLTVAEQPQTVQVTGGTVFVDIPNSFLPAGLGGTDPNTVAAKQPAHCIDVADGVVAIAPAELGSGLHPNPNVPVPTGDAARFKFPVTGGTVSPAGNDGVIQLSGGVRLLTGKGLLGFLEPSSCASGAPNTATSRSYLETLNLAPNLALGNVQSDAKIAGTQPGCNASSDPPTCPTAVFPGDKGIAIGQNISLSGATITSDSSAHTVSISGGLITNNATSSLVLGGLFPNLSGTPAMDFAAGDKFGVPTANLTTR
jgi:hypothetical protein